MRVVGKLWLVSDIAHVSWHCLHTVEIRGLSVEAFRVFSVGISPYALSVSLTHLFSFQNKRLRVYLIICCLWSLVLWLQLVLFGIFSINFLFHGVVLLLDLVIKLLCRWIIYSAVAMIL